MLEELPAKHTYLTLENQIALQIYKTAELHLKEKHINENNKTDSNHSNIHQVLPRHAFDTYFSNCSNSEMPVNLPKRRKTEILNVQMSLSLSNHSLAPRVNNQSFSNNNYAVATL